MNGGGKFVLKNLSKASNIKQNLLKRMSRNPVTQNYIILYLIKRQCQDFLVTIILYLVNSKEQRKTYFITAGNKTLVEEKGYRLVEEKGYRFLCT